MNQLSDKVDQRPARSSCFPTPTLKHARMTSRCIRTFYLSQRGRHRSLPQIAQRWSSGCPASPSSRSWSPTRRPTQLTVRGTAPMVQILEKIIQQNDKPRAEIVIDVEIIEVDRSRANTYGLNLPEHALGAVVAGGVAEWRRARPRPRPPEHSAVGASTTTTGGSPPSRAASDSPPPFNLNTISRGFSDGRFLSRRCPTAIVRFLESDTRNEARREAAASRRRGRSCRSSSAIRFRSSRPATTPIATGGAGVNPLSSYQ